MAEIELRQVEKRFGDFQAVQPIDLTIKDGEFVVLLGPSGCGKTTTLRMISGLETVTGGKIFIGGREVTWRDPADRDIAFVFQLYALYPHMTVEKNITFPLEAEKASKEVIQGRLKHVVDLLQIHVQIGEHGSGHPFSLTDEAKEDVLDGRTRDRALALRAVAGAV